MAEVEAALERLRQLHHRLDEHDEQRESLMRERDRAIRAAKDAGATYEALKETTGLNVSALQKALKRQP